MAHKRKGQLAQSEAWGKHLRKYWERLFWHGERSAEKKFIKHEI